MEFLFRHEKFQENEKNNLSENFAELLICQSCSAKSSATRPWCDCLKILVRCSKQKKTK